MHLYLYLYLCIPVDCLFPCVARVGAGLAINRSRLPAALLFGTASSKLFAHAPLIPSSITLVPVQAGKVTVRLASHWPCVTDNSGITTYGLTALGRETSTRLCSSRSRLSCFSGYASTRISSHTGIYCSKRFWRGDGANWN